MIIPYHCRWIVSIAVTIGLVIILLKIQPGFRFAYSNDTGFLQYLRSDPAHGYKHKQNGPKRITTRLALAPTTTSSPRSFPSRRPASSPDGHTQHAEGKAHHQQTHRNLNIAIVESNGVHEEVMAALIHSFGSQTNVFLHLYKKSPRFGIEKIIHDFNLPSPNHNLAWNAVTPLQNNTVPYHPDIIVLITCYDDPLDLRATLHTLLQHRKTYLFCLMHETKRWTGPNEDLDAVLKPWAEKGLLSMVCLSPAVAQTLALQGFSSWNRTGPWKIDRSILTYPPIFPVELPLIDELEPMMEEEKGGRDPESKTSIAIQGLFEYDRRDYDSVFESFAAFEEKRKLALQISSAASWGKTGKHENEPGDHSSNETLIRPAPPPPPIELNLIGHGTHPDEIPTSIERYIRHHENLPYSNFYTLLAQQTAILPAFKGDVYRWMKASSSIAAAMVAGVPLLVDAKVLKAYSYLGAEGVYLQKEGETEFDVLERVVGEPRSWRREKRRRVRERAREIWEGNVRGVGEWIIRAGVAIGVYD